MSDIIDAMIAATREERERYFVTGRDLDDQRVFRHEDDERLTPDFRGADTECVAWIGRRAMLAALRALAAQALPEGVRAAGLTALLDYTETEQLQLVRVERESSEVFATMLAALIQEAERDGR